MKKLIFTLLCTCFCFSITFSQGISYGFKAGLNFSTFNGPSEKDASLNTLETFKYNTGFHVGAAIIYKFTDLYGAKAELLFSQKGGKIEYDGPAFQDFPASDGTYKRTNGMRTSFLNISNSYIDIPILVYGRVLPWLEISGGINAAVLINSTATGEITYTGASAFSGSPVEATLTLDYNYSKDDPIDFATVTNENYDFVPLDGTSILIPRNAIGANYEFGNNLAKMYNTFDFGLNAGVSFFLNSSLFIGYRLNYGLVDISNNKADIARFEAPENGGFTFRTDKDNTLSMQVSIGFSF